MRHARPLVHALGIPAISLALVGTTLGTTPAWAEDAAEYQRRATQAFTEGKYELALHLFSTGYAETKQPEFLVRMGLTYLKLGRASEAAQACQTYLARTEGTDPTQRSYAEQCLADARRAPGQKGLAAPAAVPPPSRPAAAPATSPASTGGTGASGAASLGGSPSTSSVPSAGVSPPPPAAAPTPPPASPKPAVPDPINALLTAQDPPAAPPQAPPPAAAPAPFPPASAVPATVMPAAPPSLNTTYDLCVKHLQDGRVDNARSCYVDFVPDALRAGGVPEADLPLILTQLKRYPDPASAVPASLQTRYEERRNDGLWGAGLAMWLSAWVPALVFGPLNAEEYKPFGEKADPTKLRAIHYTLMAPVVGPFISGIWLPVVSYNSKEAAVNYSVPWIVADGITQLVGFSLLLAGYSKRRVPVRMLGSTVQNLRVAPYATGETHGVAVMGRF